LYLQKYNISVNSNTLFEFCIKNFIGIHEIKCILKLYKAYITRGDSVDKALERLSGLLQTSNAYIQILIYSLGKKDESKIRETITNLYLKGYLLDDILLGIEKGIAIFPSVDPEARFTILQFTMLGWISIQQGKENWLDTIDIVNHIMKKA